jgi:thiol-disulfide isomerase/thioredoxin
MDFKTISTVSDFEGIITQNTAFLMYFSTLSCAVGEALEPKIIDLLKKDFPKIPFYFIDIQATSEISAKYSVFVEPTVLVFFDGKEAFRKSRYISTPDLSYAISRLYKLAF